MVQEVYEGGNPFDWKLAPAIEEQIARVDLNKASLIIVDGGIGEGKTTLQVHILDYINKRRGLPPVDLKGPQMGMGGADFLNKLRLCYEQHLPCIGYDEAGDFSKRGSLTGFNAMINRTFETFRAFKIIVVICVPNFNVLDNQLFDNNIPRLLLHCSERNMRNGNFDAYDINGIRWLRYWMSKLPIKAYAWSRVTSNFNGRFLNLCPERSKELDKICTKNKLTIMEKSEAKIEGLMSYIDISNKLGKSVQSIKNLVSMNKIKPTKFIKKAAYFDDEIVNRLATIVEELPGKGFKYKRNMKPELPIS